MAARRPHVRRLAFELTLLSVGDRQHDDLELRLGRARHRCDSYYLALDPLGNAANESRSKTRRVLAAVLRGVAGALRRAGARDTVLLPYDFSDAYVGLLRFVVESDTTTVRVMRVASSLEGWELAPSRAWRLPVESWGELRPWPFGTSAEQHVTMPRTELLEALGRSQQRAMQFVRQK